MTTAELQGKQTDELRQLCRQNGLQGYPAAMIGADLAVRFLAGELTTDQVVRELLRDKPTDRALRNWVTRRAPHLMTGEPEPEGEEMLPKAPPKPAVKPQEAPEAAPPPKAEEKVAPSAKKGQDAHEAMDPRKHQHWALLLQTADAFGVHLKEALERYADDYRKQIVDLTAEIEKLRRNGIPEHNAPKDEWGVDPWYIPGAEAEEVKAYVAENKSCYLVGPAGTGKTQAVRWACRESKRKMIVASMHSHTQADTLEGYGWLTLRDGQTVQEWCTGLIQLAMEAGAVLVLDEFDRASPAVHHLFNDVLQSRSWTPKEGPAAGKTVRGKPGFLVIATGNTVSGSTGQFHATSLDRSTLSRFRVVHFWFDEQAEKKLVDSMLGLSNENRNNRILQAFRMARAKWQATDLPTALGTRNLVHLVQDLATGRPLKRAWRANCSAHQGDPWSEDFRVCDSIPQEVGLLA